MMPSFLHGFPRVALALLLALSVQACTLAPVYRRPDAPIPSTYASDSGQLQGAAGVIPWKDFFVDPNLQQVVELALENNRDLRVAMQNIEKTRAQYRIQRADLLPTVQGAAENSNQRVPADISGLPENQVIRQYSASLGFAAYELDLFGRIRSLTEQALQTYHSVENDARTAQLSLVAEVAGMYLQLVADRELLDLTRSTYLARKQQYELLDSKYRSGVASQLEVSQAQSSMEEARSNVAKYTVRVGQDENYLVLLMGTGLPKGFPEVRRLADVKSLPDVPAGLPSQLLERRPDILSAEHLLMGANANIGAARANFFPTISLTGNLGTISTDQVNLFDASSRAWSFIPQITMPIFDTGRNIARLQVSQADRDIAVSQYEKAVQTAFREVSDTLVQREHIGEQLDAEQSLVSSTKTSYDLALARFNVGVDSYLNVLDAERSLYSARQSLISSVLLRETNALTLYKALGGGWN